MVGPATYSTAAGKISTRSLKSYFKHDGSQRESGENASGLNGCPGAGRPDLVQVRGGLRTRQASVLPAPLPQPKSTTRTPAGAFMGETSFDEVQVCSISSRRNSSVNHWSSA